MGVDTSQGHKAMDYREHERTYAIFLKGTMILAIFCIVVLALMGIFLV